MVIPRVVVGNIWGGVMAIGNAWGGVVVISNVWVVLWLVLGINYNFMFDD